MNFYVLRGLRLERQLIKFKWQPFLEKCVPKDKMNVINGLPQSNTHIICHTQVKITLESSYAKVKLVARSKQIQYNLKIII